MKELDGELVIAKATEKHPGVAPRIISDNGPKFIAKNFKEFDRQYGLTHVRTSPYYPLSAMVGWNAGTVRSRANASVRVARPPGRKPRNVSESTSIITTMFDCTAPSATSRLRIAWEASAN